MELEKGRKYFRHLIECQCILPIYAKNTKIIYHKFPVFSIIDDEENVKEKHVKCNNCDIIHRVYGYGKSELIWGEEGLKGYLINKDDIRFNLELSGNENIANLLEKYNSDVSIWEFVDYIIENNISDNVLLNKEEMSTTINCKYLIFENGKPRFKSETFQRDL